MIKKLVKYEKYTRKEINAIFDPQKNFIPQRGTWGVQGIISVPNREKDFIFYVTLGKVEGKHTFVESISSDGILSWQSQPSQTLAERRIKKFIEHDHNTDNIFLFLRTHAREAYTYFGKLAYIAHDPQKERPVYFKWQVLDWDFTAEQAKAINLSLELDISKNTSKKTGTLSIIDSPSRNSNESKQPKSNDFRARHVNFDENNRLNKNLGEQGELLVLEYEKDFLIKNGKSHLADKVEHVSKTQGDGAGYDIRSYNLDGSSRFIEVKTTRAGKSTPFYLTVRELQFSKHYKDYYSLYRVSDFEEMNNTGNVFMLHGDLEELLALKPISFKASL